MLWIATTLEELQHPDTLAKIIRRIDRIATCSRCDTWLIWRPPGQLAIVRADEAEAKPTLSQNPSWLIGVYDDNAKQADVQADIAHFAELNSTARAA